MSLVGAFLKRSPAERSLFVEAAWELLRARLLLRLVPFRRVGKTLVMPVPPGTPAHPDPRELELRIARAVNKVADRAPIPLVCFPRAIAAQAMLRRRGIPVTLLFGVAKGADGQFMSHVWGVSSRGPVIGEQAAAGYTLLHRFVPDDAQPVELRDAATS